MSYGIQVGTTSGVVNLAEIPSARLLGIVTITTTSGSTPAPSGTTNIFVKLVNLTNQLQITIAVRLVGSNIVWDFSGATPPTGFSFRVLCFSGVE